MEHSKRRVMVGVDGSAPAERALDWAAREAATRGTGLDVVHAWTMPYSTYPYGGFGDRVPFEKEAQGVVDAAVEWLVGPVAAGLDVRPFLVEEDAVAALMNAAAGHELLVVGSRGHGGFVGLLVGSVSLQCAEHAPCPVAVIPASWLGDASGRVVVGVDGSQESYGALHWAIAEAARRGARLDVVNAYDFHHIASFGANVSVDEEHFAHASQALLEDMVAGALGRAVSRPTAIELIPCPTGPARALTETARGADLLVVGSRGRGGVRGVLLGSVSRQCVHHTPCPIVVTRPVQAAPESPQT